VRPQLPAQRRRGYAEVAPEDDAEGAVRRDEPAAAVGVDQRAGPLALAVVKE